MSGETKLVNEILFTFNNQILAMSNVVKKAKVIINQKLVRKIKLLSNKKGNEAELAKNKRKCENLKHEIESIKKAKLNDIAIFAFDNDGVKYDEFIKKNPKISGDQVAIARIAFHKLVEDAIEKIKKDPKLDGGWKKIFIQFKSRNEKRKNWKEKQKLVKIIEEKLEAKNETEEDKDEAAEPIEGQEEPEDEAEADGESKADQPTEKAETTIEKKAEKSAKTEKEKKKKKIKEVKEAKKKEVPIDSDGQGDDDDDAENIAYNPEDDEEDLDMERAVAFSDDDDSEAGSMPDFGISFGDEEDEDEEDEEEEEEEDEDAESDESSKPPAKKQKYEPKALAPAAPKRELKPLVVENKPTRMVIKQLNLDELKDLDEIPIESTADPKKIADDEEDEPELSAERDDQYDQYDQYSYKSKTLKANEDPFFLDPNGNEIQDVYNLAEKNNAIYYNNRFNKPRYRKDDDDFDYNFDEKEQFIQKRTSLNSSSFKSSLSSRDGGFRNGRGGGGDRPYHSDRSYNSDRSYGTRPQRGFDSHRGRGNAFRPSNDRGGDYQNNRRSFDNNRQSSSFQSRSSSAQASSIAKPSADLAKNHPSWLAKKQQEEKLKNQKFEGKKITFDD